MTSPVPAEPVTAQRDPYIDEVLLDPRVRSVLADLEQVPSKRHCRCGTQAGAGLTHHGDCWQHHTGCLAARIRRALTEGTPQ